MTIAAYPIVSAAIAGISTVMAIKSLAQGDYLGALMAGVGAFTGFSAYAAGAGGVAGTAAGVADSAVGLGAELGSLGEGIGAGIGSFGETAASLAGAGDVALTGATLGADAMTTGLASGGSMMSSLASPASLAVTQTPGILDSLAQPFKDAIGNIKDLGNGFFGDQAGNTFNKAGSMVASASSNPLMGMGKQLFSAYTADRQQKQGIEANKDAVEEADRKAEESRKMRWTRPNTPTSSVALNERSVLGGTA